MAEFDAKFSLSPLFPPCSEEMLQETSRSLARPLPLPDDYLNFLRQWNGVWISADANVFIRHKDARDADDYSEVRMLYGIPSGGEPNDLRTAGKGYKFDERVPDHMLAIGRDETWNRVCISLGKKNYGKMFMWRPGEPWEPDDNYVRTETYLHPLAGSFSEFWTSLQTEDDYWANNDDEDVEWEWEPN